ADNSEAGFIVVPDQLGRAFFPGVGSFEGNSAIGNAGPGVVVNFSASGFDDPRGPQRSFRSFSHNNFYGNDRNRPVLLVGLEVFQVSPGFDTGPSAHCGVLNVGVLGAVLGPEPTPPPPVTLPASGNFWGSAAGPSSTGAGDAAGGACDENAAVTVAKSP